MTGRDGVSLRDMLGQRTVVGTFVKIPRPEIVEIMALTGFDFLVCDAEHGQISEGDVLSLLSAARSVGIPMLVRHAACERGAINRALEGGAAGIQLARTRYAEAVQLADVMRYPPLGSRSVSLAQPAASFGRRPMREYLDASNGSVLVVGQIETADFERDLDATVAALDVAFIGPVDLSVDLGFDGDLRAAPVQAAIKRITKACAAASTFLGTFAADLDTARALFATHVKLTVCASENHSTNS